MIITIFRKVYAFGVSVANIGVSKELGVHEKTKTQVMNLVVASGMVFNFVFCIVTFLENKPLLGILNIILFAGGVLVLIINSYRRFLLARLILTFLACIVLSTSAILFRNGAEHYLIANLIIIIIYFNQKKYLVAFSVICCLLFIGIKVILKSAFVYDALPFGRVIFNMCWALTIMTTALMFFKTELLAYQAQIEKKNRELEELNHTKEKLFSIIAHDLRSPIGQLKNALDLVNREYITPEKFHEISARLSADVGHLHSTLDNLLRWSLNQFQGIQVNKEKTALAPFLRQKLDLFKQNSGQKNITLTVEGTDESVWVDPDHLLLILRNLVSNAVKYSYPGSTVYIRWKVKEENVIIEVADIGIGMSKEMAGSLFGPENILSSNGTADEKGTGLGLKLCKEFIEKNQGSIWAESGGKAGSSFYISLPQAT